jgi:mycothiol system anti-sigma-R factor
VSCGKHHDVHCRDILDQVYEFLNSEPTRVNVQNIRQHLDECAPCLREYDLENALKALVRRSCGEAAPDHLRLRIMTRISAIRVDMDDPRT